MPERHVGAIRKPTYVSMGMFDYDKRNSMDEEQSEPRAASGLKRAFHGVAENRKGKPSKGGANTGVEVPARAQEWVIRRSVCQRSERFAQCVCELYGCSRGLPNQKRRGTGWSQTRSVDGCSRPRHTQQKQHHKASAASCK